MDIVKTYVKSDNGKKNYLVSRKENSFRCRQRCRMMDGQKCRP